MKQKAQQELVGFVLIVVIVIVALMIFLAISLRQKTTTGFESVEVKNLLDSVMGYTTDCALVFEPQYETVEDLFKSAYQGRTCTNKGIKAKEYLNSTLTSMLDTLTSGEATVNGYHLDFLEKNSQGESGQLQVIGGNCENATIKSSAQRNLVSGSNSLLIRLTLCKN